MIIFLKAFLALNHLGAGITLQRSLKPQKAEWHIKKTLKIFRKQGDIYQQASALLNLGTLYDRWGKSDLAISPYQESDRLLDSIGDKFDRGRVLYSLGMACLEANKLKEAEKAFAQGKILSEESNNVLFIALNYYGIGWLEYRKGEIVKARQTLEEAITRFRKATEEMLGVVQTSFAEAEGHISGLAASAYSKYREPNYEAALKYLEYAEESYRNLDYADFSMAKVLANRARILEYSGNISDAIITFLKLLAEGKRLKSPGMMGDAAVHLVYIYYQQRSSIKEWAVLLKKLGICGLWGFAIGCFNRIKSYLGRSKYLKNPPA